MSVTSKIILSTCFASTIGTIAYVHYKQKVGYHLHSLWFQIFNTFVQTDKDRMHEGVLKDVERQRRRKAENLYLLQQQIDLTKQMKKDQAQHEVT